MIRKYHEDDVNDILATWEAASAIAHPFLSEAFLVQERHNIPNLYLPNAETWVWEAETGEGGRVVGFIALLGNEVGAIFVDPGFQRQHIGHALMDHAQSLHGQLEVEVFTENTIGRAFYERYGFTPLERKLHEATGFELLRLQYIPQGI